MNFKPCFFLVVLLFYTSMAGAVEIKLGGTEWAPYMGKNIKNHGIAAQIVTQIFARAGHGVKFSFYPWKRTQHLVKTGKLDGLAIAWFTRERAKTMGYSRPYVNTAIVLIKRKSDPFVYNQIEDLHGKLMGVILGYGYLKKIESEKIGKEFVKTLYSNLTKLERKRIDLTMEEKLNAEKIMATLPEEIQNKLVIMDTPFEVKALHMTLSRKLPNHGALLKDFDEALADMLKDGTYQLMLDNLSQKPLAVGQEKAFP